MLKMSVGTVKVVVAGAGGRMGRTILALADRDSDIEIAGAFERADHPAVGRDVGELIGVEPIGVPVHPDIRECVNQGSVVIDFTHAEAVPHHLDAAVESEKSLVIGTTGLTDAVFKKIQAASKKIAIVQAPNMSAGVNLLFRLVSLAGEALDERYDVEIVEAHHRHKKDAPSGTALELARLIAAARKIKLDEHVAYGRHGRAEERKPGEIGIHAVRGGDTVGTHEVSFTADGERIELRHCATSREAFGAGALMAAKFVCRKKTGLFNMQQVLGV